MRLPTDFQCDDCEEVFRESEEYALHDCFDSEEERLEVMLECFELQADRLNERQFEIEWSVEESIREHKRLIELCLDNNER